MFKVAFGTVVLLHLATLVLFDMGKRSVQSKIKLVRFASRLRPFA
jgi:hypothetical protein